MEIVGLIGIILAIWLATKFSYITYDILVEHIDKPTICPILSFVVTVVIAFIAINYISLAISKAISSTFILSSVNSIGGAIISTLKAIFLVGCLLWMFEEYVNPTLLVSEEQKETSYTYQPVRTLASSVIDRVDIPASKEAFTDLIDQISNKK